MATRIQTASREEGCADFAGASTAGSRHTKTPAAPAAKAPTRRKFLKTGLAGGAAATLGPWYVRKTLASSGEVNVLMWSDYLPASFIEAFQSSTGIAVNHVGVGSNEEVIAKMTAAEGRGFDIVSPTNMRAEQWQPLQLLQPFDMNRIDTAQVNPAMLAIGTDGWNFGGRGPHWLPHIWGTEAIAWRTDRWQPTDGKPSYGDIWQPDVAGMTMGRPHSMMLGAGLYMETIGELNPGDCWRAYESEDAMRPVWERITDWCVARRSYIKIFWNDADTQKNGLLHEGIVVGQTWDGPPTALKNAGEPVTYQAPREGALAWVDGMAMSVGAENIDQLYAFINFCYRPEPAGKAIDIHGYNSAVLGADTYASESYNKNMADAYPDEALKNLNPWPVEPQWYADVRAEYRNRFINA